MSAPSDFQEVISNGPFPIRMPTVKNLGQDKEWCEVKVDNVWRKIRFHDYDEVFKIPGLYETIFYRTLRCNSPNRLSALLDDVITETNVSARSLRVLDFGAGNGMGGEALQAIGVRSIVGVDILSEAKDAYLRDRPWAYDDYRIADFTKLSEEELSYFREYKFNTLMTIAALGFGDIPPLAFSTAFNLVSNDGLIAFNLRDEFLKIGRKTGFSGMIFSMIDKGIMEFEVYKRYQHRLNVLGEPIYYIAVVARKLSDIPNEMLSDGKSPDYLRATQ